MMRVHTQLTNGVTENRKNQQSAGTEDIMQWTLHLPKYKATMYSTGTTLALYWSQEVSLVQLGCKLEHDL